MLDADLVFVDGNGVRQVASTATPFPVSGASTVADGSNATQGAKADAAATDSTSSWSIVALLKGMLAQLLSTAPVQTFQSNTYNNITTKTTTVVKSGAGVLMGITINKQGSTDTIQIYDNTAGSGTLIASITDTTKASVYNYDVAFATGLTIVSGGTTAGDYTVRYR